MIERWNQDFVILVTAPEPIEMTDYNLIWNHPQDLRDLGESIETEQQKINNAVSWLENNPDDQVALSATEFYRKVESLSAPGIYSIFVVDQDYVDGNTGFESFGSKSILVSDGDFDAKYASYECSPDRLTLIENPEQYSGKKFSFTVTIAVVDYDVDVTWGNLDAYIGTLNGDPMQPIDITARPYQNRRWNVDDQVRFFGTFQGARDVGAWSYMNPTPLFGGGQSALATTSECVAG
jgi:hypothetical protein